MGNINEHTFLSYLEKQVPVTILGPSTPSVAPETITLTLIFKQYLAYLLEKMNASTDAAHQLPFTFMLSQLAMAAQFYHTYEQHKHSVNATDFRFEAPELTQSFEDMPKKIQAYFRALNAYIHDELVKKVVRYGKMANIKMAVALSLAFGSFFAMILLLEHYYIPAAITFAAISIVCSALTAVIKPGEIYGHDEVDPMRNTVALTHSRLLIYNAYSATPMIGLSADLYPTTRSPSGHGQDSPCYGIADAHRDPSLFQQKRATLLRALDTATDQHMHRDPPPAYSSISLNREIKDRILQPIPEASPTLSKELDLIVPALTKALFLTKYQQKYVDYPAYAQYRSSNSHESYFCAEHPHCEAIDVRVLRL